ncbi:MAG: zf-TFIIB domain-containing protein [Chitinophagaceae bacterium]|nr:zf-TFIIB domain-containing protein [Chitinophagaceae bacterium]
MKCPNCEEILVMTERQGVEIDYCPKCRGVWLDKGELDKIIEKSTATDSNQQLKQQLDRNRHDDDDNDGGFFNKNRGYDNNAKHNKRKGSFLGDLFDF